MFVEFSCIHSLLSTSFVMLYLADLYLLINISAQNNIHNFHMMIVFYIIFCTKLCRLWYKFNHVLYICIKHLYHTSFGPFQYHFHSFVITIYVREKNRIGARVSFDHQRNENTWYALACWHFKRIYLNTDLRTVPTSHNKQTISIWWMNNKRRLTF